MHAKQIYVFFFLYALWLGADYAHTAPPDSIPHKLSSNHLINDVPFVRQKPYLCGPASAEMILKHLGISDIDQKQIASCDSDNLRGTHWLKLVAYLNKNGMERGFYARLVVGNPEHLKRLLTAGTPIMVRQWKNSNKKSRHYRVVVGFDDRKQVFIYHDPIIKPNMEMDYSVFSNLGQIKTTAPKWSSHNLMIIIEKVEMTSEH